MKSVQDKVAFVTGGASGIGLGVVRTFLGAGMKVMIADLRPDHIDAAMASLADARDTGRLAALELDVTDRVAFEVAARKTEELFGKIHVYVASAGVGITGPIAEAGFQDWDFGLGVNLGGVVNGFVTLLPRIRAHGEGGHMVFVASQAGVSPSPRNAAIYATAKSALVGMAEAVREELAELEIGVSVLLAGFFRTNIHETERNRPDRFRKDKPQAAAPAGKPIGPQEHPLWRDPLDAGRAVLDGVLNQRLYIATHGELKGWTAGRFDEILAAYPPVTDEALARAMGRRRPANPFGVTLER
jgi:NAD(P)-dependent dehydrogenase (short-subunit alcohol dehydrogenase family)